MLRDKAVFLKPLDRAWLPIFAIDDRFRGEGHALQHAWLSELHNGIFELPLHRRVERALAAGQDLLLVVEDRQSSGRDSPPFHHLALAADLHQFNPTRQGVKVDPYTTLVSIYRRDNQTSTTMSTPGLGDEPPVRVRPLHKPQRQVLGQNIVNSALRLCFPGVDQQTIRLAARKRLSDGSYPALVLASDDGTIDSRNGLMWQRTNFCAKPYPYLRQTPPRLRSYAQAVSPFATTRS